MHQLPSNSPLSPNAFLYFHHLKKYVPNTEEFAVISEIGILLDALKILFGLYPPKLKGLFRILFRVYSAKDTKEFCLSQFIACCTTVK